MTEAVYRTPDDRFEDLPGFAFEPRYLDADAGLRMHYVDEGAGDPIVLLHGEPTWAFLYRKMIAPLSRTHRTIVPDLFGFGRSDKPTDRAFYTYDRHTESVWTLVERLELSEITFVVQDWGGPIGLRVAVEHPERVARLVILNTGLFRPGPNWPTPGFQAWRQFVERVGLELPVGKIIERSTVTDVAPDVVAGYDAPFPVPEAKTGAAMFPLLVPLRADDPGAEQMRLVRTELERWEKPALVMFSDSDPVFPARAGEKMAGWIPGAEEFHLIEGAGHFLQEDKGEEIASRIAAWLGAR